jgi:hypothetical protein
MAFDFLFYYYNNNYYYSNVMFLNENSPLFTQIVNDFACLPFWGWWGWREGRDLSTPDYNGQPLKQQKLNG